MSQSKRLLREYAQSNGKEAHSFKKIEYNFGDYGVNTLVTEDSKHLPERTQLDWEKLFYWLTKNYKIEKK